MCANVLNYEQENAFRMEATVRRLRYQKLHDFLIFVKKNISVSHKLLGIVNINVLSLVITKIHFIGEEFM